MNINKVNKRLLEDLNEILSAKPIKIIYRDIPEISGIYILSEKNIDNIVYVGKAKDLRDRIYRNHLMGDSISGIKGKIMKKGNFTKEQAKEYMKKYFFVRFMNFPAKDIVQIEHFAISILTPIFNDKNLKIQ